MTKIRPSIVIAPFANERIREWPVANFKELVSCALEDNFDVVIVGTSTQRALANFICRNFPADRVINKCGQTTWPELRFLIEQAHFVVANNSGIAHSAAALGQWVLCVFAGSHLWQEWMPRGRHVVTLARTPACSPCESDRCPNGLACTLELSGKTAYTEVMAAIDDRSRDLVFANKS